MYTVKNFKTKKALKEAVAAGETVRVYQPNDMAGVTSRVAHGTHHVTLEGPHFPEPHRWYAQATVVDGCVTAVK